MKIGAHVSIAGGVAEAPKNAAEIGCECFQMFSRSPRGGPAPELTPQVINDFQESLKQNKQVAFYIHTPYYINLASSNNKIRFGSISVIREELERSSQLGAEAVMTHLGSAKDVGEKIAVKKVAAGIKQALNGYKGKTKFLIELSAGSGMIVGDTFEEVAKIIKLGQHPEVGVCFDTAHCFASGYDLRNQAAVKKTFDQFDKVIGLKKLGLIHVNDSMVEFDSHKDRHAHLGDGEIGLDGFKALVREPRLKSVNLVLETPKDNKRIDDIKTLKRLREQ